MTAPTAPARAVLDLDPRTLLVDLNNRDDLRLDEDFIESIRELGVFTPLLAVRTADGEIRVRDGHRRCAGAIEAGQPTVPVVVIGDETDTPEAEIERLILQHSANQHRVGNTAAEQAKTITRMLDLGVPATQVAKRARVPKTAVEHAQQVAASALAAKAAARYDFLDLEKAAAVAEFENDTDAVNALVKAAQDGDGQFRHELQRLRDNHARAQALASEQARLEAEGAQVTTRYIGYGSTAVQIRELADTAGAQLTEESHATCPGRLAYIQAFRGGVDITWYCEDPKAHGHKKYRLSGSPAAGGMSEEAKAEARQVRERNNLWRSAEKVRRDWLRDTLLRRKTPPPGAVRFIIESLIHGDHALRRAIEQGHTYRELVGLPDDATKYGQASREPLLDLLAESADPRATVIGLGVVLAAYEAGTGVHTWRNGAESARRYFTALRDWGYTLSDVERLVIDRHRIRGPK